MDHRSGLPRASAAFLFESHQGIDSASGLNARAPAWMAVVFAGHTGVALSRPFEGLYTGVCG